MNDIINRKINNKSNNVKKFMTKKHFIIILIITIELIYNLEQQ